MPRATSGRAGHIAVPLLPALTVVLGAVLTFASPHGPDGGSDIPVVPAVAPAAVAVAAPAASSDTEVTDAQRAQAEARWRMMYSMQGIGAVDSPHLSALIRKGAAAAAAAATVGEGATDGMPTMDSMHHLAGMDSMAGMHSVGGINSMNGMNGMMPRDAVSAAIEDAAGSPDTPVWDERFFRRVQNRLGVRPFAGDYAEYLARMEARTQGEDSCCSPKRLELPSAEDVGPLLLPNDPALADATGPILSVAPPVAPVSVLVPPPVAGPSLELDRDRNPGVTPGPTSRRYAVRAIPLDIIYDKFGDHDPDGLMFALEEDVPRFQAGVGLGFNAGRDPIYYGDLTNPAALAPQPLVLRANVGDTVHITLTNDLPDGMRASIYMHKGIYVDGSNGSWTGFNADGTVGPGESIVYTLEIPDDATAEGTYYFYSHAQARYQVAHGLFGALIVEPKGSLWFDTFSGEPLHTRGDGGPTNWGAIISPPEAIVGKTVGAAGATQSWNPDAPEATDFREYTIFYHDRVSVVNTKGEELVDHDGLVPNPGGKALSYRTAPFLNVLEQVGDVNREPLAYSGYTMGDSSTPHPRWYVGDPSYMRVLHAGGGEHHVHHNHVNRWRRDPEVEPDQNLAHASKTDEHDVSQAVSNRIDSQIMGPGESFNIRMEGGAGSVERSVGDILFHCHFIEHVVEGMWTYHRVYNTLQAEPADTNSGQVPGGPLAELPDRAGEFLASVDSVALHDMLPFRPVAGLHKGELIDDAAKLHEFIADQLPPPVVTGRDDATGWDWIAIPDPGLGSGELFLGEPVDAFFGPGWPAAGEGEGSAAQNKTVVVGLEERPALLFNPKVYSVAGDGVPWIDARLAYPHLKPHLDKRPPFAPFGPTDPRFDDTLDDLPSGLYPGSTPPLTQGVPYMGPLLESTDEGFPSGLHTGGGLTPDGAPVRRFNIEAITLPIEYNAFGDYDPRGQIFVLSEEKADILAGLKPAQPLVLRVNEGDRVEYVITNSIPDNPADIISKSTVGIHSHLVQYDVQGSDGAVAGLNYETGMQFGESVFQSFYADVELGTVYQHDHQILLQSLPRGLFIALIVEPRNSTHHDPVTGNEILSGTVADVRLLDEFGSEVDGFRDFAVLFNDSTKMLAAKATFTDESHNSSPNNPETGYTSLNLRAEPLVNRAEHDSVDAPYVYSSTKFGDPSTDTWQAYVGDPVRLRVESAGANRAHALQLPGHMFRHEQFNPDSDFRDFWFMGPSTARDFELFPGAGGLLGKAGDYFYLDGDMDHREEGLWGIFRVFNTVDASLLKPLPGHAPPALERGETPYAPGTQVVTGSAPGSAGVPDDPWPPASTVRSYDIVAIEGPVNYTPGHTDAFDALARVFLYSQDVPAFLAGTYNPEPLVLRANQGEGIEVTLTNMLTDDAIGLMPSLIGLDPRQSLGTTLGFNDDQLVAPGATRTFKWYATEETGTCILSNTMDLEQNAGHGLWGALHVEPTGSSWLDTKTGVPLYSRADGGPNAPQAIITGPSATFREGTVFFHDNIPAFQYEVGINYRIGRREGPDESFGPVAPSIGGPHDDADIQDVSETTEHSSVVHGDPPLVLEAHEGDPYRLRLLQPGHHDHHAFSLHGHQFSINANSPGSRRLGIKSLTSGSAHNAVFEAGGPSGSSHAGDFLFHCHIMDHKKAGMWGLLRVHEPGDSLLFSLPAGP